MKIKLRIKNTTPKNRQKIISEITKADKEGVKLDTMLDTLKQYISEDNLNPTHFITFHEVNKVGINPKTPYNTPVGIYAYPLTTGIVRQIERGTIPFASDARYVSVLQPRPDANMLSINSEADIGLNIWLKIFSQDTVERFNLQGGALARDIEAIDTAAAELGEEVSYPRWRAIFNGASEIYNKKARRKHAFAKLWNVTWLASEKNPSKWNAMMRYLGFDYAYDSNSGIIHPKEKQQAVFFSKSALDVITTMPNKMQKRVVQAKQREKELGIKFRRQKHTDY